MPDFRSKREKDMVASTKAHLTREEILCRIQTQLQELNELDPRPNRSAGNLRSCAVDAVAEAAPTAAFEAIERARHHHEPCFVAGFSEAGPAIWFAFAIEKLCYAVGWALWIGANPNAWSNVADAWSSGGVLNAIPHVFHVIYGPGDAFFMLAFVHQALTAKSKSKRG